MFVTCPGSYKAPNNSKFFCRFHTIQDLLYLGIKQTMSNVMKKSLIFMVYVDALENFDLLFPFGLSNNDVFEEKKLSLT